VESFFENNDKSKGSISTVQPISLETESSALHEKYVSLELQLRYKMKSEGSKIIHLPMIPVYHICLICTCSHRLITCRRFSSSACSYSASPNVMTTFLAGRFLPEADFWISL
jgi:hypothetical protein